MSIIICYKNILSISLVFVIYKPRRIIMKILFFFYLAFVYCTQILQYQPIYIVQCSDIQREIFDYSSQSPFKIESD